MLIFFSTVRRRFVDNRAVILSLPLRCTRFLLTLFVTTNDFLFMGEAVCRGPRERHSPGPNLALNGPARALLDIHPVAFFSLSHIGRHTPECTTESRTTLNREQAIGA